MRETGRRHAIQAVALSLLAMGACSKAAPPTSMFPETIAFGQQTLTKATAWTRGGMNGVVYVPPAEKLPSAPLQVGVIVSSEHTTARALKEWITNEWYKSEGIQGFESGSTDDSCKAGVSMSSGKESRTYMTLQVCKTGVARAACVEADEDLDRNVFGGCYGDGFGRDKCFQDICDQRWSARRESLDLLAADVLSRR